jgi:tetratricopeptide (TPR) repeat protein
MPVPDDDFIFPHDASAWPETEHPQPANAKRRRFLDALDWFGRKAFPLLPKVVMGVLIVVGGILLLWAAVDAVFERAIIVEAIAVPKDFEDRGYTGMVISQRILDVISRINQDARTRKDRAQFDSTGRHEWLSKVQIPKTEINIQAIVGIVKDLFGQSETRVGGEIGGGKWGRDLTIVVRTEHEKRRYAAHLQAPDLDKLAEKAAVEVLGRIDPYTLASYYYRHQRFAEMEKVIDAILSKSDSSGRVWALNLRGNHLADERRYDEAKVYYEQAIELDRKFGLAVTNRGNIALLQGNYEVAIEAYRRALAIEPGAYVPHFNLGELLAEREDFDDAIVNLQLAVRRDPARPLAHAALGEIWIKLRDYRQAALAYRKAFEIEPNAHWLTRLGTALYHVKDDVGAVARFNAALVRLDRKADVYNSWGDALLATGDFSSARRRYEQALQASPNDAYARMQIGRSWLAQGNSPNAEAACEKALNLEDSRPVHVFCGDVFKGRKNGNAVAHYIVASLLDRQDAEVLVSLAHVLHAVDEVEEGHRALDEAEKLSPGNRTVYFSRGTWLLCAEDYKGAIKNYAEAINRYPLDQEAYSSRALALQSSGQTMEGARDQARAEAIANWKASAIGKNRSVMSMFESYSRLATPIPP